MEAIKEISVGLNAAAHVGHEYASCLGGIKQTKVGSTIS